MNVHESILSNPFSEPVHERGGSEFTELHERGTGNGETRGS